MQNRWQCLENGILSESIGLLGDDKAQSVARGVNNPRVRVVKRAKVIKDEGFINFKIKM